MWMDHGNRAKNRAIKGWKLQNYTDLHPMHGTGEETQGMQRCPMRGGRPACNESIGGWWKKEAIRIPRKKWLPCIQMKENLAEKMHLRAQSGADRQCKSSRINYGDSTWNGNGKTKMEKQKQKPSDENEKMRHSRLCTPLIEMDA